MFDTYKELIKYCDQLLPVEYFMFESPVPKVRSNAN